MKTSNLIYLGILWLCSVNLACAGSYTNAVEKQKKCQATGEYAKFVHQRRAKQPDPNYFFAEREPEEKEFFDEKSKKYKTNTARIARAIWLEIYTSNPSGTENDAYMFGWGYCMDNT